jgi:hypothetical protein
LILSNALPQCLCLSIDKEVHHPHGKLRVLPKKMTAVGAYPVAVLPGQFQDFYKR